MKNIFRIFYRDFKRVSTNVVAVVIVIGLSIIPSLYAWFNILSNWDPYGPESTSNLKIAVYSADEGIDMGGLSLNIGDSVIDALKANQTMGWQFTDTMDEATDGVYSSEYYAALIIPEDFSKKMISFLNGEVQNPQIIYYENEKKNAIAPKITSKAKTAVQEQVNATFVMLTGMKVVGKYDMLHGLVADPQPNPKCVESGKRLEELYAQALPLAETLILEFVAKLDTDEPLDKAYDHTFGEF